MARPGQICRTIVYIFSITVEDLPGIGLLEIEQDAVPCQECSLLLFVKTTLSAYFYCTTMLSTPEK
jgi:hypothetical protein